MINFGNTYDQMLLKKDTAAHILSHDIIKTDYGYKIKKVTSYVSIINTKLIINKNKSAKAIVKVNTNYRKPYQYTLYFDCDKQEIKGNSTREEMLYYKKIMEG